MNIIEVKDLYKSYKNVKALNGLSFTAKEGELLALLGVNGSGKSTTVKVLTGLIKRDSGTVRIFGKDIEDQTDEDIDAVTVSPQESAICGNLTVKENLEFFYDIYGQDAANKAQKVDEAIKRFKMEDFAARRASRLSGGQKRKLSVAITLITAPKIVFLDEPTLGLDILTRRELWKILEGLKGKTTIVLTTHYLEEAEHLCDSVAIISKGKLIIQDTVENIKKKYDATFEEAFIKAVEEVEL